MNKAVLIAAALVLAPLALSSQEVPDSQDREAPSLQRKGERAATNSRTDDLSQSALKHRVAEAIETVEDACAADVSVFCGKVTPGGRRVALCMLAHEDRLSGRCGAALHRAAGKLRDNVERAADACLNEIRSLCGDAGKIGQCLEQKKGSLSSSCGTIVAALGQSQPAPLVGMPVYSSDNKNLGQIVEIIRGPDDKVQSIQVDIGRLLGIGTKVVGIAADKLEQLPRVKLLVSDTEVRSLPAAKTP